MSAPDGYIEGFVCTLDTCAVEDWGYVQYRPSVPGNALFLAVMAVLAICQLVLGIIHKTRSFTVTMCLGLTTEAVGYIARVLMNGNPFNRDYFLWYLITLTIGPVFIAAGIYLTIGRIVVVYGQGISRIKPQLYTTFFLGCDIASLCVQAVGGGIAASTPVTDQAMVLLSFAFHTLIEILTVCHLQIDVGTNILVAGLSIQVACLFAFSACSLEFLWRVRKHPDRRNPDFSSLVSSRRFKLFLYGRFPYPELWNDRTALLSVS